MESDHIIEITTANRAAVASPQHVMIVYIECAVKTTMHTLYETFVKDIIERNKDNHMNLANALFTTVNADTKWQYQYLSFTNAALCYDPSYIRHRLIRFEPNKYILKEDILKLIKIFFAFSDNDPKAFNYLGISLEDWQRLSEKYAIDKKYLVEIAWTYPFLAVMVLHIYSAVERPVGMNMLWDYPGFRTEMRFFGLLGIVPRYGKCGGFIKALLHYTVLEVRKGICMTITKSISNITSKSKSNSNITSNSLAFRVQNSMNGILREIIGLARVIYHTELNEYSTRDEFFKCLNITNENMRCWSAIFNEQYPEFKDIHVDYFEQTD